VKARNAFFNLEKLGATASEYRVNFYGTDYGTTPGTKGKSLGIDSDRLMADWELSDPKVVALSAGETPLKAAIEPVSTIVIMNDWLQLVDQEPERARAEQLRIRAEFLEAFGYGFVARGFWRDDERPGYLLYRA
jgi:chorismate synthase